MSGRTVICSNTGGLGNRLKNYISCLRKHKIVKILNSCDANLFPELKLATTEDLKAHPTVNGWRLAVAPEDQMHLSGCQTIDFLYEKTPEYFIAEYRRQFDSISVNPLVVEKIEQFATEWDGMLGVHVRSWFCSRREWHNNDLFEREIDKLSPDVRIFLCSDRFSTLEHFKNRYAGRVITYPRTVYDVDSGIVQDARVTEEAFIEMRLLSKCKTIIGTYASTFTECAWWLGACRARVIIPEPPNVPNDFRREIIKTDSRT